MYTSVIILVIVYTLFLLYVYIKYNLDAKNENINEIRITNAYMAYVIKYIYA